MQAWDDSFNVTSVGSLKVLQGWEAYPQDWCLGTDGKYYRLVPLPDAPDDVVNRWCWYVRYGRT